MAHGVGNKLIRMHDFLCIWMWVKNDGFYHNGVQGLQDCIIEKQIDPVPTELLDSVDEGSIQSAQNNHYS